MVFTTRNKQSAFDSVKASTDIKMKSLSNKHAQEFLNFELSVKVPLGEDASNLFDHLYQQPVSRQDNRDLHSCKSGCSG